MSSAKQPWGSPQPETVEERLFLRLRRRAIQRRRRTARGMGLLVVLLVGTPTVTTPRGLDAARELDILAGRPPRRLDLQRATSSQLAQLPGLTPRLAKRIAAARDLRGSIRDEADLACIPGLTHNRRRLLAAHLKIRDP